MVGPRKNECHSLLVILFPHEFWGGGGSSRGDAVHLLLLWIPSLLLGLETKRARPTNAPLGSRSRCSAPLCRSVDTETADVSPFQYFDSLAMFVSSPRLSGHQVICSCERRFETSGELPDGEGHIRMGKHDFPARAGLNSWKQGCQLSSQLLPLFDTPWRRPSGLDKFCRLFLGCLHSRQLWVPLFRVP
jgi:hypothetical protein